jgi:aminodeoxychorismate lyase
MSAAPFQEEPLSGPAKNVRWFKISGGNLEPGDATLLGPYNQGFQYGEGVFETLRTCGGKAILLDRHMQRLSDSARFLEMPFAEDVSPIAAALVELVPREDAMVKMILSRSDGERYEDADTHAVLSLRVSPYTPTAPELYQKGAVLITAAAQRSATSPLHRFKTLNYLENITARREARSQGAYEALIINTDDFIAECSMANIFFVLDGAVLTPSVESNILQGITREAILSLCASNGIEHDERLMNFADILFAQEVFITNSLIGVMPVCEIDGKGFGDVCPGPLTERLSKMYARDVLGMPEP